MNWFNTFSDSIILIFELPFDENVFQEITFSSSLNWFPLRFLAMFVFLFLLFLLFLLLLFMFISLIVQTVKFVRMVIPDQSLFKEFKQWRTKAGRLIQIVEGSSSMVRQSMDY